MQLMMYEHQRRCLLVTGQALHAARPWFSVSSINDEAELAIWADEMRAFTQWSPEPATSSLLQPHKLP